MGLADAYENEVRLQREAAARAEAAALAVARGRAAEQDKPLDPDLRELMDLFLTSQIPQRLTGQVKYEPIGGHTTAPHAWLIETTSMRPAWHVKWTFRWTDIEGYQLSDPLVYAFDSRGNSVPLQASVHFYQAAPRRVGVGSENPEPVWFVASTGRFAPFKYWLSDPVPWARHRVGSSRGGRGFEERLAYALRRFGQAAGPDGFLDLDKVL